MMIDEGQISFVKGYLTGNGISSHQLQDDLLDHFCCVIEENMEEGQSFNDSFTKAIDRITPDGPEKIQNDLNYLLTIKKSVMLRKLVFLASYLSVFIVLFAAALRIPQIISADLALLLVMQGILIFSITTVPYFFYDRYQKSIRTLKSE